MILPLSKGYNVIDNTIIIPKNINNTIDAIMSIIVILFYPLVI